ncbi:MAG: hypothetical protein OEY48_03650 [Gammaproteobacteria bacterium]|nr:hypothetical protein [Gammaproteobacteria bacterium]MDH5591922.1 hypothetical protein [Gammaproteobacteria bacterium]
MSTISAYQAGLAGIQSGIQGLNNNAAKIASTESLQFDADISQPMIHMISNKHQVQASAKVIETSNEMLGTILDIKA